MSDNEKLEQQTPAPHDLNATENPSSLSTNDASVPDETPIQEESEVLSTNPEPALSSSPNEELQAVSDQSDSTEPVEAAPADPASDEVVNESTPTQVEDIQVPEVEKEVEVKEADSPVSEETVAPVEAVDSDAETHAEAASEPQDEEKHEDEEEEEELAEGQVDLNKLSKQELVELLEEQVNSTPIEEITFDVDRIKSLYYKIYRAEVENMRRAFIAEGGESAEFTYDPDPLEERLKQAVSLFKRLKSEYMAAQEKVKLLNLAQKFEIIEKIKELINGQESLNKTFNDFKSLQNQWHEVGPIPQGEMKNLWETYHHTVEQFYDYIKINRELRDLDQKKNWEAKVAICERAEELLLEPSVVKAFKALQELHDRWREIGPVSPEKREEVWQRFKQATTTINKNHQDYFENLKKEQQTNLDAKRALVEKAEELADLSIQDLKEWDKKSEELLELQKLWKTIGFATKKENNKVFEDFRTACDRFFAKKREFFQEFKGEQQENLQLKTDLCLQAEAIKDSDDWRTTSQELIALQKRWKEIGPVPRKHSDALWKRFRSACNAFFDRKNKHFENIDSIHDENLQQKLALIDKIKSYAKSDSAEENIAALREFQNEWSAIGHVPMKQKDKVQEEYREALSAQYEKLKIDEGKRNVLQFKQKLENLQQDGQGGKKNKQMNYERDRILNRIRQLEADIQLLDNNIGFFAKTKNAESLINDVKQKIERARKQIQVEKQKLDVLHKFE